MRSPLHRRRRLHLRLRYPHSHPQTHTHSGSSSSVSITINIHVVIITIPRHLVFFVFYLNLLDLLFFIIRILIRIKRPDALTCKREAFIIGAGSRSGSRSGAEDASTCSGGSFPLLGLRLRLRQGTVGGLSGCLVLVWGLLGLRLGLSLVVMVAEEACLGLSLSLGLGLGLGLGLYGGEIVGADVVGDAVFVLGNVFGGDGEDGERAAKHFVSFSSLAEWLG